jgi:F-type H+-transporting ATPase subunit delta
MAGASQNSRAAGREQLEQLLRSGGGDATMIGDELFAVVGVLASSAGLRRALSDPSRDAGVKVGLVRQLLGGKVSEGTVDLVSGLAGSRWSAPGDLVDTVESLAVEAVLAAAEQAGRLDAVEDELFRFSRAIAADQGLRDAMSQRTAGRDRKAELVATLLGGRAAPETVRLATQAATTPRGLRTEQVLLRQVDAAARRREQLLAEVVVATPLSESQRDRLAAALRRLYGRAIQLNVDVDPAVIGGLRIQVGGELLDSTVLGRLDTARRRLAG